MTETVSILTITGDIFSTIIVEKNKKYDVLDIYDLFNNNEKISETNEKFNIIYNDNVIFCNNSYIYFSDEVSFNNKNVTIVFNKNDIKIDIDISLFKKYKMMTDSNNLELTFNDIKKINMVIIMIIYLKQ